MTGFLFAAGLFVLVTVALGLARVLYGPGEADRLMAAQLLGSGGVAVLLLLAVAMDSPPVIDVALMLALLATFASVAFVNKAPSVATAEPDGAGER
ncbi:MAG: multiple resistance and pH regulation protein F [Gammaproteobacteria bacterium]|nr:multiple resistance and pH regulation protein F [Gammaproteobacteria bacterium]